MNKTKAELVVRNIGELVTIAGYSESPIRNPSENDLGILKGPDICVASIDGRILFIGKNSDLAAEIDIASAREIDARGRLVIPGFVDCHTHAIFAGSRENELAMKLGGLSYLEILKRGGGILRTVRETRRADASELSTETRKRLDRMVNFGTTTFEIKSGYGLDVENEIKLLEVIGELRSEYGYDIEPTLLSAHAIPEEYFGNPEGYINDVVKPTIDISSERKIAKFCDVFLEKGVFNSRQAREILMYARKSGLLPKVHADEFSDLSGANLALELGAISADHLLKASQEGIKSLSNSKTICVLLPGTSFSSFVGNYANSSEINNQGGAIALATDLSPNSWIESMQFVMSLACYGMKITPAQALIASTINAAHAIDRTGDVGSIETGKLCDLLIMDLENYAQIPYRIASNSVSVVIKKGNVIREFQS